MILSFLFFLGVFVAIGVSSYFVSRGTQKDYYLASSSIPPSLVGLSAVATNNSGYMFIGVIGYTYATGFASIWLMIGWIVGDFLASSFVHSRLRKATQGTGEVSYAAVLSHWHGQKSIRLQRLIGLISLVFLLAYTGAQFVAGSKALHALFGWPTWAGSLLSAALVLLYCYAGGIRASIWTDAAQAVVMIAAMTLLLVIAVSSLGGLSEAVNRMGEIEGFLNLFPRDLVFPGLAGGLLFAGGWMFAGLSVIGQPHVMVRFMCLSKTGQMRRARTWYYVWYILFYVAATGVGMLSRVFIGDTGTFDAELALPTMALQLLPPVLVGLVLAGIFAATMSTADSLVLSCSAALTHDLMPQKIERAIWIKTATVVVTVAALGWALINQQSVFSLVIMAWSGLASAFAPLLIANCFGTRSSEITSIAAACTGLAVALLWRYFELHNAVYEGLPGILAGLLVIYGGLLRQKLQAVDGQASKEMS